MAERCLGCRSCIEACPHKSLTYTDKGIVIDRRTCDGCGYCVEACPSTAMELLGQRWSVDNLIAEVIKDRVYFEASGGGVTLSGGEPSMQADFSAAFLKGLKERGIRTALDTCGQCGPAILDRLLPFADIVLFDLKEIDPERHRAFTGQTNTLILANLEQTASFLHQKGRDLWIRTPIIPQATDTEANILGIGRFIVEHVPGVYRWELCAFNNLCRDKYLRLDKDWLFKDSALLTGEWMEALTAMARQSGVDPGIVHWSGATRL
jgi:pyruvate formate lyase activating enzyme